MSRRGAFRRFFRLPTPNASRIREDVDAELEFHFQMRAEELVRQGMTPDAAREQARREFGDVGFTARYCRQVDRQRVRETNRSELAHGVLQDVRYAWRQLRLNPGFAAIAVLTLALGIGATTAIFGAVNGVLLEPLPYAGADRIVTISDLDLKTGEADDGASPGNFLEWEQRATSFEAMGALDPYGLDLAGADGPEAIPSWLVTAGFFRVMGTRPLLGRTLGAGDFVPGQDRVVVISEPLWRTRFGSDPGILERTVVLDGEPWSIVGIMPPEFRYPAGGDMWSPKIFSERERQNRVASYYEVVAKLKPGVTVEAARAELAGIALQLGREYPRTNAAMGVSLVPLGERLTGSVRPALLVLLGAVGLVLLIACANVANLMLARALKREREFAIRAALGAGRTRVLRQLGVESVMLALLGGGAGVLLAHWGVRAVRALAPSTLPRVEEIGVDGRVLAFALAVSLGTALFCGLAPALRAARPNLHDALKASGRAATTGGRRITLRSGLVVAQLAVAILLLVGAGLLGRSFISLLQVERGFRTDNVLAVTVQAWQYYPSPPQRAVFVQQAVERFSALRGVTAAGVTSSLPLHEAVGSDEAGFIRADRPPPGPGEAPEVRAAAVSPGYFTALGIPLRRGRTFTATDASDAPPVVVISESMARRFWPGEDPVGKRIVTRVAVGKGGTHEIVGVVGDVRHEGLEHDPPPFIYAPHAQAPTGAIIFVVRTRADPAAMVQAVKQELWAMNKSLPISSTATLEGLLDDSLRERRFHLSLLGVFAATALLLAAVGIYGVMSHATTERTREIGVRVALGARAADVVRMVMRQGGTLAIAGLAIGLLCAALLTRLMRNMLYGVTPTDPTTFILGAAVVLVLAAAATYIPARRATRIPATEALRAE